MEKEVTNREKTAFYYRSERRGRLVTLLILIREIPGSNLSPQNAYLSREFSWFFSVPPDKYWNDALK
jgi:hypothetical protein